MKKLILVFIFIFLAGLLFSDLENDRSPLEIPVFYPFSDSFFANRFQSASMAVQQAPNFFFFDCIGELLYIPEFASIKYSTASPDAVVRMAGAIGSMIKINKYFTGMAGISGVMDGLVIASSYNLFGAAGLFAHYELFGIDFGLGIFGGYYWNSFRQLQERKDQPGKYDGILEDQTPEITHARRFIITPKINTSALDFFLESLGGAVSVTEDLSTGSVLGDLAFKELKTWLLNFNIDLYYRANWYNLYMKDRQLGASFASKHFSLEIGYRWFEPQKTISFLENYSDGPYGRVVVKFPAFGVDLLLSYSFETTFETLHYIGAGFSLPLDDWRNNLFYEFAGNYLQNMRFSASNVTGGEL